VDLLDAITRGFVAALGLGYQALHAYSLPLLAALAVIHAYQMWGAAAAQGGNVGDALAGSLLMLVRIGTFFWGLTHLWAMGDAALHTFVQWGAEAGRSPFTVADFLHPSRIWAMGWTIARPVDEFISRHSGWQVVWNAPDLVLYSIARLVIVASFWLAALHVLLTIIEFFLAVVVGAVLIPWGVLSATSSLCEFALSWLVGGCIRSLLTALIMAIGTPMLENLPIATSNGDPTLFGAMTVAAAAITLAILIWHVPKRATLVAGRGMALGLGGDVLTTGAVTGWRTTLQGLSLVNTGTGLAIRGISRLVQARP
jgi:P-type conjugative transfer protein TrbL